MVLIGVLLGAINGLQLLICREKHTLSQPLAAFLDSILFFLSA